MRWILVMLVVSTLLAPALTGCARSIAADPLDTSYQPGDIAGEMAYWAALPERSFVTNDEALHGVILVIEGEDPSSTFEQRVAYVKERGWLPDGWDEAPDVAARRGMVARIVTRAIDLRGGVMMRVTAQHPRYATRELVERRILPPGSAWQTISGLEFVGIISKVQDEMMLREPEPQPEPEPGDGSTETIGDG